jgi:1-deoxy-D-xylulose-5-phosphate synthase
MRQLAAEDDRLLAITAAMPDGTGLPGLPVNILTVFLMWGFPSNMPLPLRQGWRRQVSARYLPSIPHFLQRAYDEVFDVCLQNLPVIFAIDRAGVVGNDGPTHHGVFDLSYLRIFPNLTILAPKDENELRHMLLTAIELGGPVALRYPRGPGYGVPLISHLFPCARVLGNYYAAAAGRIAGSGYHGQAGPDCRRSVGRRGDFCGGC